MATRHCPYLNVIHAFAEASLIGSNFDITKFVTKDVSRPFWFAGPALSPTYTWHTLARDDNELIMLFVRHEFTVIVRSWIIFWSSVGKNAIQSGHQHGCTRHVY